MNVICHGSQASPSGLEALPNQLPSEPLEVVRPEILDEPALAHEGCEALGDTATVLQPAGTDLTSLDLAELVSEVLVADVLDRQRICR